jgi:hypothetical protein
LQDRGRIKDRRPGGWQSISHAPKSANLVVLERFGEAVRDNDHATDLSQAVRIAKSGSDFTVRASIVEARVT